MLEIIENILLEQDDKYISYKKLIICYFMLAFSIKLIKPLYIISGFLGLTDHITLLQVKVILQDCISLCLKEILLTAALVYS